MRRLVVLGLAAACACSHAPRRETTPMVLATSIPVIETAPAIASMATPIEVPPAVATDTPDVFAALALLPKIDQEHTPAAIPATFGVKLSKIWATKVGRTTFRTTMALIADTLIIGTHADPYADPYADADADPYADADLRRRFLTSATIAFDSPSHVLPCVIIRCPM